MFLLSIYRRIIVLILHGVAISFGILVKQYFMFFHFFSFTFTIHYFLYYVFNLAIFFQFIRFFLKFLRFNESRLMKKCFICFFYVFSIFFLLFLFIMLDVFPRIYSNEFIILVLNINSYGVYNPLSYSVIVFVKSNLFFASSKWY